MSIINLRAGDCYKLLKTLKPGSVDLILTDPPYNLNGYSTGNLKCHWRKDFNNDIASWDKTPLNIPRLKEEFIRVLKPTGNIFIFTAYNLLGEYHQHFDPLFDTFQIMVWHKTNPPPKLRKTGFLNSCELICCMWNKGHTWNFKSQKQMHNFFESPICMGRERLGHPTQKPVKLLQYMVEIASRPTDTVLDPFMGVGSTGEAALALKRNFIGFEIDKTYYNKAKKRLHNLTLPLFKEKTPGYIPRVPTRQSGSQSQPLEKSF